MKPENYNMWADVVNISLRPEDYGYLALYVSITTDLNVSKSLKKVKGKTLSHGRGKEKQRKT